MKALREAVEVGPPGAGAEPSPGGRARARGVRRRGQRQRPHPRRQRSSRAFFEGLVKVEIGPLGDFSQLVGFEDAAGQIGATSEISVERFSEGRATLSMRLDEPVELLRELEERSAAGLPRPPHRRRQPDPRHRRGSGPRAAAPPSPSGLAALSINSEPILGVSLSWKSVALGSAKLRGSRPLSSTSQRFVSQLPITSLISAANQHVLAWHADPRETHGLAPSTISCGLAGAWAWRSAAARLRRRPRFVAGL